jgi:hypothetical protein
MATLSSLKSSPGLPVERRHFAAELAGAASEGDAEETGAENDLAHGKHLSGLAAPGPTQRKLE